MKDGEYIQIIDSKLLHINVKEMIRTNVLRGIADSSVSIKEYTLKNLNDWMNIAIDYEMYESAAIIRDEINSRTK